MLRKVSVGGGNKFPFYVIIRVYGLLMVGVGFFFLSELGRDQA